MRSGSRIFWPLFAAALGVACTSPGPGPRKEPAAQKRPAAAPAQSEKAAAKSYPIVVKALLHSIDPGLDDDKRYTLVFIVDELIRGSFEAPQIVDDVSSVRRSFPWITDDDFEGSVIYLHMTRKRGGYYLEGFSEKADGPITAAR